MAKITKENEENCINFTHHYICFWGSIFSNWAKTPFENEDGEWDNSEQYFMWLKAKYFNDDEIAEKITNTPNPEEAKALGRKIKNFNKELWDIVCYEKMYDAVYAKFTLNAKAYKEITSDIYSLNKHFVEGSPFDKIWGVGLIWDCPEISDRRNWRGRNLLGKVLDQVRYDILNGIEL